MITGWEPKAWSQEARVPRSARTLTCFMTLGESLHFCLSLFSSPLCEGKKVPMLQRISAKENTGRCLKKHF